MVFLKVQILANLNKKGLPQAIQLYFAAGPPSSLVNDKLLGAQEGVTAVAIVSGESKCVNHIVWHIGHCFYTALPNTECTILTFGLFSVQICDSFVVLYLLK